jgi:Glyoxalase/Bleomycin resistance protein/Dioxygenase superfamily
MLTGFHHVTVNVTDLSRARAFYEGVLGLEEDQDFPGEKLRLRIGETGRLVLRPPLPGTASGDRFSEQRIGLDHLAIGVSGRGSWSNSRRSCAATVSPRTCITTRWARRLSPFATPTISSGSSSSRSNRVSRPRFRSRVSPSSYPLRVSKGRPHGGLIERCVHHASLPPHDRLLSVRTPLMGVWRHAMK